MDLTGFIYDYRLGYVRENTQGGFDILGDDAAHGGRILTLGGYTTPKLAEERSSWASLLYERLSRSVQIYNGCTDGFTSAQELIMFIRDGILLKPKILLQLSGFHDFAYKLGLLRERQHAQLLDKHPYTTPRQIAFYEKITSKFGLGNDRVFYGEEDDTPAWEGWLSRVESVNTLCLEFGIKHLAFLQPSAFSPGYLRTATEDAAICESYDLTQNELTDIAPRFHEQYAKTREAALSRDYVIDLSALSDGDSGVYTDAYHLRGEHINRLVDTICKALNVKAAKAV